MHCISSQPLQCICLDSNLNCPTADINRTMGELSPHEFLRQQGATFVVFHPCAEQLVLGLGLSEQPAVVPHCISYRKAVVTAAGKDGSSLTTAAGALAHAHTAWPHQQAYETLLAVSSSLADVSTSNLLMGDRVLQGWSGTMAATVPSP